MDKDFILDEIRRCAAKNGGTALGKERFEAATGITEQAWRGKYWVRWNDVLEAAGYPPNKMNAAHDEAHLLRQLAILVRDLGRFPVEAEIRLRRRQEPTFPSSNTFRRFGNKDGMVRRLAEYCSTSDDLQDVAEICALLVASAAVDVGQTGPGAAAAKADEYVYLMKSGKYYKVGRTNDVGRRTYEVGLVLPEPLVEVHHFATDDAEGIERYWHRRFRDRHVKGEWFKLTPNDVATFKRRRRFM